MRNTFDEQLGNLNTLLIEMGGLTETAISKAIEALEKQDRTLAQKAIEYDAEVDHKEKEIERLCLHLLLTHQPVARDLRLVSAALKMITDMERIGDQAADISELTIHLADKPYIKKLEHIPLMADAAIKMVTDAVDAFVRKDLALAGKVISADDTVDKMFLAVRSDLTALIRVSGDNAEQAFDLMMIAKYLERIGDHAVNIAEWVVFSLTGYHNGGGLAE